MRKDTVGAGSESTVEWMAPEGFARGKVQVFVAGSGIGSITQQNGRYLLVNVPVGIHSLTAERIGYRTVTSEVTVTAGGTTVQDFALSQEALGLDEIIVTGTPGGTQRRAIGNSVLSVQAADITASVAVNNIQDLMTGRTPGLQFNASATGVGTGSGIQIRGVGSFNLSSNPLIYVDGIRINNASDAGPQIGSRENAVSVLNDINAGDIESIEIIKGPAAATLYGTEASAGVVQIITKRGATGAPQFDLAVRAGVCPLPARPGRKDGDAVGCQDKPGKTACRENLIMYNPYDEANFLIANDYFDWPTERLYQNGMSQSYNLSVRGGTDAVRYFILGNYDDEEGILYYNTNEAFRLRGNVSVVFNENFSFDLSTAYTDGATQFAAHGIG